MVTDLPLMLLHRSTPRRARPGGPYLLGTLIFLVTLTTAAGAEPPGDFDGFAGRVMTGYQGWFNTPDDGAGKGWTHFARRGGFLPGSCSIDFWPDTSEYERTYATPFTMADGSPARVFSSYDASTVGLHFRWMAEYGIDGAFMQRFIHSLDEAKVRNHYDTVFASAVEAATQNGRALSIRYDLTGMEPGDTAVLLGDLDQLNASFDFFGRSGSPTFLHHAGKPLIAIGGIGFADDGVGGDLGHLDAADVLIAALRERGYAVLMRVPALWRSFRGNMTLQDPVDQERFLRLCRSVDVLMPWHVGAYREDSYVGGNWQQKIAADLAWCREQAVEYAPVIFPGFSRANLKGGEDGSFRPRNGGSFYWLQATGAVEAGADMIFVAQFDEMDEGTQIFKCASIVPTGPSPLVAYDETLGSDHYLWLTGEVGRLLRGEVDHSAPLPRRR